MVGTTVLILVKDAAETAVEAVLNLTLLLLGTVSKLLPLIVTTVPAAPTVGEKLVTVGPPVLATLNALVLNAVATPTLTLITPFVAPTGTDATSWVVEAEITVA